MWPSTELDAFVFASLETKEEQEYTADDSNLPVILVSVHSARHLGMCVQCPSSW